MRFAYTYRSSDGLRHTAEIEAESRDAVFAKVRAELGVKPIRVTMAGHGGAERAASASAAPRGGMRKAAVFAAAAALLSAVLVGAWRQTRTAGPARHAAGDGRTDSAKVCVDLSPLPRQAISGDRRRIEKAVRAVFESDAEAYLARFAEPGRGVPDVRPPDAKAFMECLNVPLRATASELTEHIDLKRIVEGMKLELKAYVSGGGTVAQYLSELVARQRREIECREKAERKVLELLNDSKAAYAYWLKANAQLQSMGIWPIPLPDPLRAYQTGLDIEE